MKTPLGTEVNLGVGHIVLDGFPALRERATAPPLLGPCLLWPRSPIWATAELLLAFYVWGADWRHLANTTEPSICSGDVALCQITLTTCLSAHRSGTRQHPEWPETVLNMDGLIAASKHTVRHMQCCAVRFGYLGLMSLYHSKDD